MPLDPPGAFLRVGGAPLDGRGLLGHGPDRGRRAARRRDIADQGRLQGAQCLDAALGGAHVGVAQGPGGAVGVATEQVQGDGAARDARQWQAAAGVIGLAGKQQPQAGRIGGQGLAPVGGRGAGSQAQDQEHGRAKHLRAAGEGVDHCV